MANYCCCRKVIKASSPLVLVRGEEDLLLLRLLRGSTSGGWHVNVDMAILGLGLWAWGCVENVYGE